MENLAQALAEADDAFIFNSEKENRQHADSEDQKRDQLQNSNTVIIVPSSACAGSRCVC